MNNAQRFDSKLMDAVVLELLFISRELGVKWFKLKLKKTIWILKEVKGCNLSHKIINFVLLLLLVRLINYCVGNRGLAVNLKLFYI